MIPLLRRTVQAGSIPAAIRDNLLDCYNITRQALSISIAMYAISQLNVSNTNEDGTTVSLWNQAKQNIGFLIWSVIAFLFHQGGIICILALPICYFMKKKNSVRVIMLVVFALIIKNFRSFVKLAIAITGSTDFQWYFIANVGGEGSWLKFILRFFPYILMIWLCYKSLLKDQKLFDLYNLTLIGLIINSLSLLIATDIERIGFPFLYYLIIVTGFAMKDANYNGFLVGNKIYISKKIIRIYKLFIYLFLVWTMWYVFFYAGAYEVVPYQTIFSK